MRPGTLKGDVVIPFGPTVHVLKVTLRDVKPAVWRRIVVLSETPLPKFARMLEKAMGGRATTYTCSMSAASCSAASTRTPTT